MDSTPLIVAILVGAGVGILTALGLWIRANRRRMRVAEPPEARRASIVERMLPVLRLVSMPLGIRRRWSTEHIRQRLRHAGLAWKAEDYAVLRWLVLWLAVIAGLGLAFSRGWDLVGQFLALLVVLAGFVGPGVWLAWTVEQRLMDIDLALPDFLDRLALGLEAGLGFEIALRRTSAGFPGLLGEDLRRMVRELDRGHARSEALDELAGRSPSQDLRTFAASVKQADRLGTSLAKALRVQTTLVRARRRRKAQEASRRLPILIVFPLVFCFLPALLIIYLAPPLLHLFLKR
ncbi:MAG: type II secretion system F family protein [Anaerolineales bacterium]